ncbi:Uncharacterised protein [Paucimonas lemoignei]|jgi:hypothetical protein|nr:Uncharacterised protein [Paucimonas lemoignei]
MSVVRFTGPTNPTSGMSTMERKFASLMTEQFRPHRAVIEMASNK